MTAADNIAIPGRSTRQFRFTRKRSGAADAEFFPGAGSRLKFANRDTDTFVAQSVPAGLLQSGDTVTVEYKGSGSWVCVFSGEVDSITDRHGRGDERVQDVVCAGPWSKMNRLVFRQQWTLAGAGSGGTDVVFSSSRVILNQSPVGAAQTMAAQITEILTYAASKCGFAVGNVAALEQLLPLDEARDITCADALRRELRFFPKRIVRFDYSGSTPSIEVVEPSTDPASYVASIPMTSREYQYTAHPVSCVDVAVDAQDIIVGGTSSTYHQVYPEGADTTALDCLHVTIPLARGSSSTTNESFESVTEEITSALIGSTAWWKAKHPRLANVAASAITISNASRSPANYPRIAKSTKGEIEAAGLHCEVSRVTCNCKIATAEDEEEDIILTMDFLTTDATTRTYTWQTGSSSTAGETLPDRLAESLYNQRSGSLVSERMTVRLGAAFPKLGDAADGLYLQSFEVYLDDLTAHLSFGQPEHLSPEDMRSLLNGFRQRGYATTAKLRADSSDEDADEADAPGGIPPIASSEWSPGKKTKTTISASGSGSGGNSVVIDTTGPAAKINIGGSGGNIVLDSSSTDNTIETHKLSVSKGSSQLAEVDILASSDLDIDLDGNATTEDDTGYCNAISDDNGGIGGGDDDGGNDISRTPCNE